MYARCGAPEEAYAALVAIANPSIVSWNALISGFVHRGLDEAAMECFEQIVARGFFPNAVTFTCLLKACASAGDLRKGESAHGEVARRGFAAEDDGILGTALVEMYARCGIVSAARQVHSKLLRRDAVSWSSLISGYADQGLGDEALSCFRAMVEDGFPATASSLACLLSACSHSGLVDEGEAVYLSMSSGYGVAQSLEHHACIVDLLGRSGQLEKAAAIVSRLPSSDHYPPVLGAFMGACHKCWDLGLAKLAFSQAMQWSENDSAAYVCFANICSASGPIGDSEDVERLLPSE
jgi:pentatricopeptide repeat protein